MTEGRPVVDRRALPLPLREAAGGGVGRVSDPRPLPPAPSLKGRGSSCDTPHDLDTLFPGVRLLDPASGLDVLGELLVRDGVIADFGSGLGRPDGAAVDPGGRRGALPRPGRYARRAGRAGLRIPRDHRLGRRGRRRGRHHHARRAARHAPAIDDPALVRLLRARGEETGSLTILPYAAVTRGCRGEELAELGLLREAGAVAFTDGATRDRLGAADAAGAVLRARLRRPHRAASGGADRSPPAAPRPRASWRPASACPASPPPPRRSRSRATSAWRS